ncbi:MAG: acetyl ornithine aminotransferase family protein [Candidatus Eremiobacter antarcticus]|nr:acetyl ornithine aminotransferase family protein [Candidatus Eremiobacteraeota bacterium]PZR60913.1 MAG: acetyl ornithine aminotransferase family protein [Candidatus Eremiobacter sp. RRmetagenome_bin22]
MAKNYPYIATPPPGPNARRIIALDQAYSSPSYIKEYPLVVERGEGPMIEDVDGNRFLDFMAGIAVASTGHSHPNVVAAIEAAAHKFLHICATDFYYAGFSRLCERLARLAPGPEPKRVFLTNSGTEATEGAIKLVRAHTKRQNIIAFRGGFHGRTMGAISLNSSKVRYRAGFGPLLPGVYHLPYADPYHCSVGHKPSECGDPLSCALEEADSLFHERLDPSEVAAVFMEPILGEGGYIIPPREFLQYWRDFCDEHGAVLVFDEVQSGMGRTGHMFAADMFDIAPDVTLLAKGLASGMPLGAIIAKESVMTWGRGSHGSTFGGNPVCCAAAEATLDLIEQSLMKNAARVGAKLIEGARALQQKHDIIGDVRGAGLMIGITFVRDRITKEPYHGLVPELELAAFKRGLLLLGCGRSTIRLAPPLVIDEEDAANGLRILDEALMELRVAA